MIARAPLVAAFVAVWFASGVAAAEGDDLRMRGGKVEPADLRTDVRDLADGLTLPRAPSPEKTRVEGDLVATRVTDDVVRVDDKSSGRQWTLWNPRWTRAGLVLLDSGSSDKPIMSQKRALRLRNRGEVALYHHFNSYTTDRSFQDYGSALGKSFSRYVDKLGAKSHWVDLGAGHALAQRGYLEARARRGAPVASLTAVSLSVPPQAFDREGLFSSEPVSDWMAREKPSNFRYVVGKVEAIKGGTLDGADLVTDVYGAFYYSQKPDKVLRRALETLRPGGRFYATVTADAKMLAWLRQVRGARVVETGKGDGIDYVVLERTRDSVRVPAVKVTEYSLRGPGRNPLIRRLEIEKAKGRSKGQRRRAARQAPGRSKPRATTRKAASRRAR